MPLTNAKSTNFVHVPGDPRAWAPFDYVFRNRTQFLDGFDIDGSPYGLVFCPTRRNLPIGFPVRVVVRLGRRRPPLHLDGQVIWRRSGRHAEKVRAGVGVEFQIGEKSKLGFVTQAVAVEENVKSRRRHERVSLTLPVHWHLEGQVGALPGTLRDIGRGGAFVRTGSPVPSDTSVIVELAAPGAEVAMSIAARVAWIGRLGDDSGFGLEWRARDAGGGRRIRELVRRLTETAVSWPA